jgi:hypothetical protein
VLERLGYAEAATPPPAPASQSGPASTKRLTDEEAEALLVQEWMAAEGERG